MEPSDQKREMETKLHLKIALALKTMEDEWNQSQGPSFNQIELEYDRELRKLLSLAVYSDIDVVSKMKDLCDLREQILAYRARKAAQLKTIPKPEVPVLQESRKIPEISNYLKNPRSQKPLVEQTFRHIPIYIEKTQKENLRKNAVEHHSDPPLLANLKSKKPSQTALQPAYPVTEESTGNTFSIDTIEFGSVSTVATSALLTTSDMSESIEDSQISNFPSSSTYQSSQLTWDTNERSSRPDSDISATPSFFSQPPRSHKTGRTRSPKSSASEVTESFGVSPIAIVSSELSYGTPSSYCEPGTMSLLAEIDLMETPSSVTSSRFDPTSLETPSIKSNPLRFKASYGKQPTVPITTKPAPSVKPVQKLGPPHPKHEPSAQPTKSAPVPILVRSNPNPHQIPALPQNSTSIKPVQSQPTLPITTKPASSTNFLPKNNRGEIPPEPSVSSPPPFSSHSFREVSLSAHSLDSYADELSAYSLSELSVSHQNEFDLSPIPKGAPAKPEQMNLTVGDLSTEGQDHSVLSRSSFFDSFFDPSQKPTHSSGLRSFGPSSSTHFKEMNQKERQEKHVRFSEIEWLLNDEITNGTIPESPVFDGVLKEIPDSTQLDSSNEAYDRLRIRYRRIISAMGLQS